VLAQRERARLAVPIFDGPLRIGRLVFAEKKPPGRFCVPTALVIGIDLSRLEGKTTGKFSAEQTQVAIADDALPASQ
jgi:hypothetical protein